MRRLKKGKTKPSENNEESQDHNEELQDLENQSHEVDRKDVSVQENQS